VIGLGEGLAGARLLASLPRFLRRPITVDEARRTLRHRLWRDAGLLRVERRPPLVTAAGKILHLHANGGGSRPSSPGPPG
jgi:hypothetical protein